MAMLGCIADDFTGAGDMASFLEMGGMRVLLFNGIPESADDMDADAIVIALKTRSMETSGAVGESLRAIQWLQGKNCEKFYVKYCSTFDSTPQGNIGPICDAVMEALSVRYTILSPALPVNGRTVKDGCLYVRGIPLHESHMKTHPLNPMWDCDISILMRPQSKYPVYKPANLPGMGFENLPMRAELVTAEHFYIVPDCVSEMDCERIAESFCELKLLTGGSGLARPLAELLMGKINDKIRRELIHNGVEGPALILAGSCSETTLEQIENYNVAGGVSFRLNPDELISGRITLSMFKNLIMKHISESILIYSCDCTENVHRLPESKKREAAAVIENAMAELAEFALSSGVVRFIVAGGETSGAVTKRLGFQKYMIGDSIAPGVPIMTPVENKNIRLVLKSGNFGQPDFFLRALSLTGGEE